MAEGENLGAKFSIDISNLKAGLAQANRLMRESNSEFKAAAAGMDDWSKSEDGLTAKLKQLTNTLDVQEEVLRAYEKQYEEAGYAQDDMSAAAVELRTKINNQKAAIANTRKEAEKYQQKLSELQAESEKTATASENLRKTVKAQEKQLADLKEEYVNVTLEQGENSEAAQELLKRISDLSGEIDENKSKLDSANKALKNLQSESGKAETASEKLRKTISKQTDELDDLKEQYTNVVLEQGKDSDAAKALRKKIAELTREIGENNDKLDDATHGLREVEEAAEKSGDGFTIAKGAVAGFIANGLTALVGACKNAVSSVLGLSEATREYREDMAKLDTAFSTTGHKTADAKKSYEDFYAILGESDRSIEAINHLAELTNSQEELSKWSTIAAGVTAKFGDSLPIEGLTEAANETAKVGKVTGPLADALNWAGESEDAFNEKLEACNSEQERSQLITNTLNGLYEEAAEKYNEQTKSQQDARRSTAEFEAAQAELGDAIEPVTTKLTDLKTQGLQWLIDTGLPAAKEGFEWVKTNIAPIATLIGGVTTAIIAQNVATKAKAISDLAAASGMTVMKLAQQGLNTAMKANPIGLIITAVTLLVSAFMLLWKNCEGFRNFFIGMWDGIKKAAGAVADWFVETWQTVSTFFADMWSGLKDGAVDAWEGIKKVFGKIKDWFKEKFTEAWTAVKNVFSTGGKIFSGIKEGIEKTFKTVVNKIISGINKIISVPFNAINKMLNKIRNISFLNISPFSNLWGENPLTVPVIPKLAKGGVVKSATTAVIGENGKEAIVPLERNTEWIDKVADKVASKQPKSVIVNQTNNYSQAHSRYEIYKSKQQTAAAVRLALQGAKG